MKVLVALRNRSDEVALVEVKGVGDTLPESTRDSYSQGIIRGWLDVGITDPKELCSYTSKGQGIVVYEGLISAYDELRELPKGCRWARIDTLDNLILGGPPEFGPMVVRSLKSLVGAAKLPVQTRKEPVSPLPRNLPYELFLSWEMGFKDGTYGFRGRLTNGIPVNPELYEAYVTGFRQGEENRNSLAKQKMAEYGFNPTLFTESYGNIPEPWKTIK